MVERWAADFNIEHEWSLFSFQNRQLTLKSGSGVGGLVPGVVGEEREQQRRNELQVAGKVMRVADRFSEPAKKTTNRSANKPANEPAKATRASVVPALLFLSGMVCVVFGFGMIATGCHVVGVLSLVFSLLLFWLPYGMATPANVGKSRSLVGVSGTTPFPAGNAPIIEMLPGSSIRGPIDIRLDDGREFSIDAEGSMGTAPN